RSRVSRGLAPSMQLLAIRASAGRALERVASTFAGNSPARFQEPDPISIKGTSESVSATPVGSFGSLNSSVSTTGTITTCRSSSALSSSCESSPAPPSNKPTTDIVSDALIVQLVVVLQGAVRLPYI